MFESSEKSRALPEHSALATRYSPTRQDGPRDCHETRAIESGPGVGGKIDPQLPTQSLIAMLSELFDDPENVRVTNRPVEIGEPKAPRAKSPKRVTCFAYANHGTRLRETRSPTTLPASPPPTTDFGEILANRSGHGAHGKGRPPREPSPKKHPKNYKQTTCNHKPSRKRLAESTPGSEKIAVRPRLSHPTQHLGKPRGERTKWDHTKTTLPDKANKE